MSKYAYYDPASLRVLDWMDTELFCYPERTSLIELTEQQWLEHFNLGQYVWVNVKDRAFITNLPPGEFYRLNGNTWVYDAASFAIVLDNAKSRVRQAIKVRRDEVTADYIVIGDYHFHSDANSRIQQMSLTRMGQAQQIPAGLMWQTKNNGLIELTNDIAAQFETVTVDHDMRLFANAQRHIAEVEALEDIQAVIDYDYSSGWQP
ncbi:DUF4376 domain-containing protein [Salmonella enterica subsp. enterica]|nr:DUF4376 domain-containing protein [Salmonella enterica subsp. enterica]MIF52617.1 DUF4376 domain-containing protein [Salmonella enterica subsp. enterica]